MNRTRASYRTALRDVVRHCIYAVDKNPLAVDLCKVALWIESHAVGLPLGFLDHHIKCGDSLIGVMDTSVLAKAYLMRRTRPLRATIRTQPPFTGVVIPRNSKVSEL